MHNWLSKTLIRWYHQHKRDLPWRHEKDPYKIWLSEVILQQTQVAQGLSYYYRFVEAYPEVKHLAKAPEDEVLKHWQGLGYYSRARNLHQAAKTIVKDYKGRFPADYPAIRGLKGVGDYTAAAIASFAYNLPYAVLDGNVYRVLSRIFGIATAIDSTAGKKEFQALADRLLDQKNPADHNQAIMEFGSQYCKPVNPACDACIFKSRCFAFQNNLVSALPAKEKKVKIRPRVFNYLVIGDKNKRFLLRKRGGNDIWQGLYEFPLLETTEVLQSDQVLKNPALKQLCSGKTVLLFESKAYKHILSHQHLQAKFFVIRTNGNFRHENGISCNYNELNSYAFPRLIEKFLDDCSLKEML